ncbi:Cytochrome b5 like Heme Steroid binding domain [Trypanosoma vivax]|uniref:Putative cytochrome b5 n=1 Tax=Trypanosoma vivax (strain Y486) TaxID=1055687 RepID=G0U8N8_TRYVY|nr:putative cytochrome b5 [Trypanosoma vivax]KAH8604891.1 Cytochrome b5 like Heme Steroid binding domain [Trypanosoma vivax]CCC53965.1 putative cytochrome b5 [Trypanosoma vivax Y486]
MDRILSLGEVRKHVTEDDLWLVINGRVYDVSTYVDQHPGGVDTLIGVAGKDGTADFESVGHSESARELLERHCIGTLDPEDLKSLKGTTKSGQLPLNLIAVAFIVAAVIIYIILAP